MAHVSWKNCEFNFGELETLRKKARENLSKYASEYQHGLIPVFDAEKIDFSNKDVQADIYNTYYDYTGVMIVKNMYSKNVMDNYNQWCEVS